MNFRPLSLEEMQDRLLKLEKQNRRLKQLGAVALIGVTLLVAMGQAPAKKTVEANEFILGGRQREHTRKTVYDSEIDHNYEHSRHEYRSASSA